MQLALQILGIIFLVVIGVIIALVIVFVYLKARLNKWLENVSGGPTFTPMRMPLQPVPDDFDDASEDLRRADAQFKAAGLTPIGAFEAETSAGLYIRAYLEPTRRAYGIAYQVPPSTVALDLVAIYEPTAEEVDAGATFAGLTVANSAFVGHAPQPPGQQKVIRPDATVEEMLAAFDEHVDTSRQKDLSAERFVTDFQTAYAYDMDHQARTGITETQVRAIANLEGNAVDEEAVRDALIMSQRNLGTALEIFFLDRYRDESHVLASQWEAMEDELWTVTPYTTPSEVRMRMTATGDEEEDDVSETSLEMPGRGDPFAAIEQLRIDPKIAARTEMLWSTDDPVRGEVWRVRSADETP